MEFDKDKLQWLEFDLLKEYPWISHGVFLRHGGLSRAPFHSLNLSDAVGDHPDNVKANRELVRQVIKVPQIVYAKQEHKAYVLEITSANISKIPAADALFTRLKDVGLAITHADCQAAIIYDPANEVIAAVHAGYKGLGLNIYKEVIQSLKQKVNSKPKDLIVCISPSLGPDHAEFINYKTELPEYFWEYQKKPQYFDLWMIGVNQLLDIGIQKKNIEISEICTYCTSPDYYSHRKDKKTGRNATIVAMQS